MVELAKLLKIRLADFRGLTVEPGFDDLIVMHDDDVITQCLAEIIFEFAKEQHLNVYIGVSIFGHLRLVLYKD